MLQELAVQQGTLQPSLDNLHSEHSWNFLPIYWYNQWADSSFLYSTIVIPMLEAFLSPIFGGLWKASKTHVPHHPNMAPAALLHFGRGGLRLWLWLLLSSQFSWFHGWPDLRVSWYLNLAIHGYSSKKQGHTQRAMRNENAENFRWRAPTFKFEMLILLVDVRNAVNLKNIHPGRLTWNLQITHLERKMIFQTSMIMFHVNLQGCMHTKRVEVNYLCHLWSRSILYSAWSLATQVSMGTMMA